MKSMAWRDLHDPKVGGHMTAEEIRELAISAGLSEADAQKLATRRGNDRLDRNLPP